MDSPMQLEAETLERLRAGLRLMALQSLGDPEAADEAVQETLARAVQALAAGRLRERAKLGAFVAGIARHVIADVHRSRGRTTGLNEELMTDPAAGADSLSVLIATEDRQRLRFALRGLSDRDREVLRLSFFEGHTPAEIAAIIGEAAPTVRKQKQRALRRLRRAFFGARHASGIPPTEETKTDLNEVDSGGSIVQ
jgi:RNA polymerase sigma-70 factor (ECF subfamily)